PATGFKMVSPAYFETFRIRLLRGRALAPTDRAGAPLAMVINKTMADTVFKGREPIGQHLEMPFIEPDRPKLSPDVSWEVVGVIADENTEGLGQAAYGGVYVPLAQNPFPSVSLAVRSAVPTASLQTAVRDAIHAVDKRQAIASMRPMSEWR